MSGKLIEFYRFSIVLCQRNAVGEYLRLDIVTKAGHSLLDTGLRLDGHMHTVGNLQSAILSDILDAVNELTCHTLVTEFVGEFHLQCDREVAFVADKPAGNILADDIYINSLNGKGLSLNTDVDGTLLLEHRDIVL